MAALTSLGIYIHIPICDSLCGYCDFYSIKRNEIDGDFWNKYYKKLIEEFQFKSFHIQKNYVLNSIYFGGGTPSLAPVSFIDKVINFLVQKIPGLNTKIEITMEANPETVTGTFVEDIFSCGVNRVSMGVQSLNDRDLKMLDRLSSKETILKAMKVLSEGPIHNWSADIIYGIPGQKEQDILESLESIIRHDVKHISAYALTLDKNFLPAHKDTLENDYGKKISETRQYSHQKLVWNYLPANGFPQYEISNFARNGYSCLHNVAVWKYRPYLSLGTSGHSFLNNVRYRTIANIQKYLSDPVEDSIITEKSSIIPDLFITTLRLRTTQGNVLYRKLLNDQSYKLWENLLDEFYVNKWAIQKKSGFEITAAGLNYSNTLLESVYEKLA